MKINLIIILILLVLFLYYNNCKKENFSNINNKKNMIFTSIGDNTNFHNNWTGLNQNYDIYAIYYGNNEEKYNMYKNHVKYIEKKRWKI